MSSGIHLELGIHEYHADTDHIGSTGLRKSADGLKAFRMWQDTKHERKG